MDLEPMPRITRNSIIPPNSELRKPAILGIEFQRRDLLKWVFLRIPLDADVVDGLLLEVLEELCAE
jgi:hypothetical protein